MQSELNLVLQVQKLDQRIAELEKEIAQLPLEVAKIEKALESHKRRLDADKAALAANLRDRKKLEGDIQVFATKMSKLKDQLMQAKNNEQYHAFQHEITFAETETRKCEDGIIELMSSAEPLEAAVKKAEAALAAEQKEVNAEKNKAMRRFNEDKEFLTAAIAERKIQSALLTPAISLMYERIRKKHKGGMVLGIVDNGRCMACQMALRLQYYQELRKSDKLMTCESCGRILFYNKPQDFTADIAGKPAAL